MAECREQCLSAGMNAVMTKPIKIEDLTFALETWSGSALVSPGVIAGFLLPADSAPANL